MLSKAFAFNHERPDLSLNEAVAELCRRYQNDEQRMQQRQVAPQPQQAFNPALAQQQQHAQQQQQQHLQQGQMPPQFQPPTNFLSPAQAAHPNLPINNMNASPALMSNHNTPAMQNLALQQSNPMGAPAPPGSVAMAHQASYQGTNPSAAGTPATGSANASPNVNITGKRRRPSGVNLPGEDGMDGAQTNGIGPAGPGAGAGTGAGQLVGTGKTVKQSPRVGGKRQKGNP